MPLRYITIVLLACGCARGPQPATPETRNTIADALALASVAARGVAQIEDPAACAVGTALAPVLASAGSAMREGADSIPAGVVDLTACGLDAQPMPEEVSAYGSIALSAVGFALEASGVRERDCVGWAWGTAAVALAGNLLITIADGPTTVAWADTRVHLEVCDG